MLYISDILIMHSGNKHKNKDIYISLFFTFSQTQKITLSNTPALCHPNIHLNCQCIKSNHQSSIHSHYTLKGHIHSHSRQTWRSLTNCIQQAPEILVFGNLSSSQSGKGVTFNQCLNYMKYSDDHEQSPVMFPSLNNFL